jgi:hypothetical protein
LKKSGHSHEHVFNNALHETSASGAVLAVANPCGIFELVRKP